MLEQLAVQLAWHCSTVSPTPISVSDDVKRAHHRIASSNEHLVHREKAHGVYRAAES